jgi:hypothetical protein
VTGETAANDPRLMWQSQEKEHPIMSTEEIRRKGQIVQSRVRRNLIMAFVCGVLLLVICTIVIVELPSTFFRVIASAMIMMVSPITYETYYRIWSRHTLAPTAALKGCLTFYRSELQAQYRAAALMWRFLVPTLVFVFLMWRLWFRANPLVPRIVFPSVLLFILVERRRQIRNLKRKLAAVSEFEKESSPCS